MSYCHEQRFNTEEQKTRVKDVKKVVSGFVSNPKVVATGYGDFSTFKWLWNKATGTPWDPVTFKIDKSDIARFKVEASDFISEIGKNPAGWRQWFKLPKRLTDKMPETEAFTQGISDAISFRQRHLRENGVKVDSMLKGLEKMFHMEEYYGKAIKKSDYKEYQNLELELELAKSVTQRRKALDKIIKKAGLKDSDNNPVLGQILFRFNDLITFRSNAKNEVERQIQRDWNDVRKDSASMALSGINHAKRLIQTVKDLPTRHRLKLAISRLESAANRIFFQSKTDNLKIVKDPDLSQFRIKENEIKVYDADSNTMKPHKVYDPSTNKFETPIELTKYAPEYVIELANTTRYITEFAMNPKDARFKDMTADKILNEIETKVDLGAMINRLKAKGDAQSEHFYSLDPAFYLKKYIHDVSHFNFATKIHLDYKNAVDKMFSVIRKGKYNTAELSDWAKSHLDVLTDIKDSALNMHEGKIAEMNNVVRAITGLEYISKLGFSIKGAIKNRTQGLFDFIQFGTRIYTKVPDFYSSNKMHVEMADRQMNRFGFKFGEKATAAGIAEATRGSIDIEKANRIDPEKGLTIEGMSKGTVANRAIDASADFASGFWGPLSHKGVENSNRINTFKRSFALTYMEMMKQSDYWAKEWMRSRNTKVEPSDKQLAEFIEYKAGNLAANMVKTLHFEYDRWAKAKVLKTGPGQVVGQFQTFKFAFWDLQYQMLKGAVKDARAGTMIRDGKISPEVARAMRLLSMYSFITYGISALTDHDFTNVIQNDSFQFMGQIKDWLTADPDSATTNEEFEREVKKKHMSFFGGGPLVGNMGPAVNDLLALAELYDFWDRTPAEYQELLHHKYNPDDPKWNENVDRIIMGNALARWKWHVIPSLLRGSEESTLRQVTGLYQPKWVDKWIPIDPFNMRDMDESFSKQRRDWLKDKPWSVANLYSKYILDGQKEVFKKSNKKGSINDYYRLTGQSHLKPPSVETGESLEAIDILDKILAGEL